STKPPGFLSVVVQSPIEGDKYNIGSTRIVKWKSSLPADTEIVIEILASPIFDFNPPEMVWKTTARVIDGQVKFVVGHWSHLNIFFVKIYAQNYPRISGIS
ncbi:25342_t:CDS:2, partial [Gigaspora rosea]